MKIRFCAAMLLAALSVGLLAGCATSAATQSPRTMTAPTTQESITPGSSGSSAPAQSAAPTAAPLITKEDAIAIALQDAGFTEDQVTRIRTEFGYDNRRPEYEVDFRQGGFEYDYEIHAETGAILSRDRDRED